MNNQSNPNTQGNVQRFEDSSMGMVERKIGNYVLHSAYAELAAKLGRTVEAMQMAQIHQQAAESQLAEERELRMSLESSWQQAEAQLAELRGKLVDLADWLKRRAPHSLHRYDEWAMNHAANELSTLAAAEGE